MSGRAIAAKLTLLVGCLLLPDIAAAQSSGIAGIVKDSSGGVLPGVTVEASSPALIERVRTAITDEHGAYRIVNLRPGIYAVTFSLEGFTTARRENVELAPEFTAPINIEMGVGSLQETVTVTSQSPLVDVQNASQGEKLSREVIDTIPTNKGMLGFAALTPAVVSPPNAQDVGGSQGELSVRMAIHGGKQGDQKLLQDGMRYNSLIGDGTGRTFFINPASAEAITVTLGSGGSAESSVGGVLVNLIPKDGGNIFSGYFFTNYTNSALQSDNLTDSLRAQGLTSVNGIGNIYDFNGAFGGPIQRDKLWFFTSARHWGKSNKVVNGYHDATLGSPIYTPDLTQPDFVLERNFSENVRFTWKATDKAKVTFSQDAQNNCCNSGGSGATVLSGSLAWEAQPLSHYGPNNALTQVTWTYPVSSKLLLEAGGTVFYLKYPIDGQNNDPNSISILEQSTSFRYNAPATYLSHSLSSQTNERFSMSYVTGSHNVKVGMFYEWGVSGPSKETNNSGLGYTLSSGVPISLTESAPTHTLSHLSPDFALFAQDQWTISRLTLNVGLRFDYLRTDAEPVTAAGNILVPARNFPGYDCIPCWKDINPRLGVVYDVFGNGKTAVKASIGRYVSAATVGLAETYSPSAGAVSSVTRSWNDTNHNFSPDCVITNPAANGECGPISDPAFGQTKATTVPDPAILNGWGKRGYNWQASATIDHELTPNLLLNAGYFRTWYGNFTVTDNLSVGPQNYDPYCITAPVDARLPGSGSQICGLYDINPAYFGQVNNVVAFASGYGKQTEVYNGVDLNFVARLPKKGMLSGGVNVGDAVSTSSNLGVTTSATSNCFVIDSPQQLYHCNAQPPYQPRFKVFGSYPLVWGLQASANFQTLPGTPISATYSVPTAQIAPSLGRNLAGGAKTAAVDLMVPYSAFEDRINQLDIRLTRMFVFGRTHVEGMFDVYNVTDGSPVVGVNTTYGPNWLRPQQILDGRLFKFGLQIHF